MPPTSPMVFTRGSLPCTPAPAAAVRDGRVRDLVCRSLGTRLDHQLVDVDVRGPGGHPRDGVGDVLGQQRLVDAGVHRVGLLLVAAEAHERELVGPDHPGGDLADAHRLAVELEPQRLGHHLHAVLGGGVARAALVRPAPGRRPDVDDHRVAAGAEGGQQRLGHPDEAEDVDVVHPAPGVEVGPVDPVDPDGTAGVVDQHVAGRHRRGERVDRRLVGDVARDGLAPDLGGEVLDAVGAAGGAHDAEALRRQGAGRRGTDAAGGAGHDGGAGLGAVGAVMRPSCQDPCCKMRG